MSLSSRRRRLQVPTEGSWRMVDGENDSFDTRYLSSSFDDDNDDDDDDDDDDDGCDSNNGHNLSFDASTSQLSIGYSSQYSFSAGHNGHSGGGTSFGSQDSIRDFNIHHGDDEQLILREPFRPTVPPSVSGGISSSGITSSTTRATTTPIIAASRGPSLHHISPDLQLRMPRVDIESNPTSSQGESLRASRAGFDWQWNQSQSQSQNHHHHHHQNQYRHHDAGSRTAEPGPVVMDEPEEQCTPYRVRAQTRTRRKSSRGQAGSGLESIRVAATAKRKTETSAARPKSPPKTKPASRCSSRRVLGYSIASIVLGITAYYSSSTGGSNSRLLSHLASSLDAVSSLFPAAVPAAAAAAASSALGPLCSIPGAAHVNFPFCEPPPRTSSSEKIKTKAKTKTKTKTATRSSAICSIDFRDLVTIQAKLQDILRRGHIASSTPLDLEASEIAARNLRSSLRDHASSSSSTLYFYSSSSSSYGSSAPPTLVPELSNYIEKVGRAAPLLQALYIHIRSTVDAVININRWTVRHLSALSVDHAPDSAAQLLPRLLAWGPRALLGPLLPGNPLSSRSSRAAASNDRILRDKYAEHILLVQARLARLIDEASSLGLLLAHTHSLLNSVQTLARDSLPPPSPPERPSLLSSLWSRYIGQTPRTTDSPTPLHIDPAASASSIGGSESLSSSSSSGSDSGSGGNGGSSSSSSSSSSSNSAHRGSNRTLDLDVLQTVDTQLASLIPHIHHLVEALRDIHAELQDLLRQSTLAPDAWSRADDDINNHDDDGNAIGNDNGNGNDYDYDYDTGNPPPTTLSEQIDLVTVGLRVLEEANRRNADP